MKSAAITVKYEQNDHLYVKSFIMDASENVNRWGVNKDTIRDTLERTAIAKPLVLTHDFNHPMPPELDRVADSYYDNDDDPYNTVKIDDIVEHWLAYQEAFRIGNIIDITEKNGIYYGITEVTDPQAKEAFRNNEIPLFVSPAIAQLDPSEDPSNITKWTFVHLALVSNPAYTIKKAIVTGQCHESADNPNEKGKCLLQLRQASVVNKDNNQSALFGCGFCRSKALARYAEVVKSWHTRHSVTLNKPKTVKTQEDFLNSSIEFLESQNNTLELSETENNTQQVNQNQQEQQEVITTNNQGIKIKEPKDKINPNPNVPVEGEKIDPNTGQPYKGTGHIAEEFGIKLAGMEECVQIFTQNGVAPDQSVQICKLAAKALMENQQGQNPNQPQGGGRSSGNGPGISGQFGSVADYEKEVTKKELKIAELEEQLKNYKKDDKSDTQKIAELQETVNKLNLNLKEKEIEAYLVTKIADEGLRNEKIKKWASMGFELDDIKDIFETNTVKSNGNGTNVKKTASVVEQPVSPISRVKLQVASTNQETDTKPVNEVREFNNRISSLLSNKRYQ